MQRQISTNAVGDNCETEVVTKRGQRSERTGLLPMVFWLRRRAMQFVLGVFLLVIASVSVGSAEGVTAYDLRSAEFKVPADWKITYSRRDQEYDFASPDGRFQLWARWWFPDEPLLGFDDIIRHDKRILAGQEALFRHLESGGERSLELAFLKEDDEGEIFLWQLHSSDAPLAEHEAMFDSLLAGLTLDGQPTVAAAAPVPAPAEAGNLAPVQGGMYRDADGAFALPLPSGWTVQTTASQGLRQVVLVSPARDAMLLAAVANGDRAMSAAQVLDEYMGVLYRDSLVVKSIEGEGYPDVAGTTVHAIETIAKVYAINGIAMPYPRGRVRIYRSSEETQGAAPFLMISIRSETAPPAMTELLEHIALGFTFDTSAPPAQAAPLATGGLASIPATPAGGQGVIAGMPGLIFDGETIAGLLPFAFNQVTFEDHAKLIDNAISFGFPDGHGWGKLGFATPSAVVVMPQRDSALAQRITAILDADKSTGISFALVPVAEAQKDPWEAHDLRVQFSTTGDGNGKLEVTTKDRSRTLRAYFRWPKGETVLHLLLRPDQVLDVRDGSDTQLAELALNGDFSARQWALQTYLQVHRKNGAASLVLKRLSVDSIAFQPSPAVDAIVQGARSAVVFDGFALGRIWAPVGRYEGEFARFAGLSDGALRIGWSGEDEGNWSGIDSSEAVLWLDRFTGAAEARIELALDGAASKDFEIALQSRYTLPGNLTGNDSYVLRFTEREDGTYGVLSAIRSKAKEGIEANGLRVIPDRVTLVLRPEGIRVEGEGMPEGVLPFAQLKDGAGFRIAIHAMRTLTGDGALVLRGVRVSQRPGNYPPAAAPAAGVAALPQTVYFDARPDETWEVRSSGKADVATLAIQQPDGLTLTRRDPVPDWQRIALVGGARAVDLDYRVDTTPYELTLKLAPEQGLGTRIFLHTNPAKFDDAAKSVLTLRELTEGPEAGGLEVRLHTGHFYYDHWRRVLPAAQWRNGWDGTVRLRFGPDWIAVALGDDWLMRGARQGRAFMLAITPGGAGNTDSGNVTLRGISGGWITPEGMSEAERWRLVDADVFDPDAFADLLATDLVEKR
ncbi:hypothetical protein LZG00_03405 [Rhodobacteraceae bacterium LMO-12]|nr:hypothetical protein [Rhodobacteraceae bacterium LMO-JJ12]